MKQRVERVYSPSRVGHDRNMVDIQLLKQSGDCFEPDLHANIDANRRRASEAWSSSQSNLKSFSAEYVMFYYLRHTDRHI